MTNNIQVNMETLEIMVNGAVKDQALSKSQLFELLYDEGLTIAEIKQLTGCHYSFIFGVVTKKCEKREVKRTGGKADTIRQMLWEGKTVSEIAKELQTNYSYVFTVAKKWKQANIEAPIEATIVQPATEEEEDEAPMTPFEIEANKPKLTKKEIIMNMHNAGCSVEEIAEAADTTIKYVKNTIKSAQ